MSPTWLSRLYAEWPEDLVLVEGTDIYYQNSEGIWFVEETDSDAYGPYPTLEKAIEGCKEYCDWLHAGPGHDDIPI